MFTYAGKHIIYLLFFLSIFLKLASFTNIASHKDINHMLIALRTRIGIIAISKRHSIYVVIPT